MAPRRIEFGRAHRKVGWLPVLAAVLAPSCTDGGDSMTGARTPSPPAAVVSPLDPEGAGSFVERKLRFRGEDRTYGLYVPEPGPTGPAPLVAFLHGPAEQAAGLEDELEASGLAPVADQEGFLVVLPTSLLGPWRVAHDAAENEADTDWLAAFGRDSFAAAGWEHGDEDAAFIMAVIEEVSSSRDVDPARVYTAGKQNGAFMASRMVCDHPDRFAAVGALAGGLYQSEACTGIPAVPGFAAIGGLQTTLPPELVEQAAAEWAERNGCDPEPTVARVAPDVSEVRYRGCEADADVVFQLVEGVGFLWPWPPPASVQTSGYHPGIGMWTFFARHALR